MLSLLLKAVGVPILISIGITVASWWVTARVETESGPAIGGAFAFVTSFFVGFILINGSIPPFPPSSTVNWIPFIAAAAGLVGGVQLIWPGPWWIRWGVRLLLVRGSFWLTLHPILSHQLSGPEATLWAWAWDVSVLGIWWSVERCHDQIHPAVSPVLFLVPGTAASMLLIGVIYYASMALALGAFGGGLGVIAVAGAIKPDRDLARGVLPVAVLLFPLMLVTGSMFSTGSMSGRWAYLLLAFVPLSGWTVQLAGESDPRGWRRIVLTTTLAVILTLALFAVPFAVDSSGGEGGTGSPTETEKEGGGESGDPYGEDYGYD